MMTLIAAAALAAAAPAPSQGGMQMPVGQMPGMDMSQTDHSKMDHMAQKGGDCCKHTPDGKMECSMSEKGDTPSAHQGHSGP